MKNIIKHGLLLLIGASLTIPAFAQLNVHEIDEQLHKVVAKDSLPGLAVTIVNNKGVVYTGCLGKADIAQGKPYTAQTIQPVGSVSKMILSVALMKCVELGYFTLETRVNQILPFKIVNPLEPDHEITIRELATHSSGIVDNPDIYPNTYQFNLKVRPYTEGLVASLPPLQYKQKVTDTTLKDFCYNYLAEKGKYYSRDNFVYTLGNRTSSYCNIGTALIAYLIEIKSGLAYSAFTTKYIFKPLHMAHSGWFLADVKLENYAQLYFNAQSNFPLFDLLTYPDGGLKTSAADLSKFLIDVINGLSGKSAILKRESFQTMFTPQFSALHPPARISLTKRNKGILWNLYTNGTIGHDGDDPGVSAFLVFNPATQMGGLFLCNKYQDDKSDLVSVLAKAINK